MVIFFIIYTPLFYKKIWLRSQWVSRFFLPTLEIKGTKVPKICKPTSHSQFINMYNNTRCQQWFSMSLKQGIACQNCYSISHQNMRQSIFVTYLILIPMYKANGLHISKTKRKIQIFTNVLKGERWPLCLIRLEHN